MYSLRNEVEESLLKSKEISPLREYTSVGMTTNHTHSTIFMKHIAILDFGSQYTHLIARRIRELEVFAKIYPTDTAADKLPKDVAGIVLSGGPQSVYDKESPQIDEEIFNLGLPILGLCYGHQLMAHTLGGEVKAGKIKEYGQAELKIENKSPIFKKIKTSSTVWMSHGDSVSKLPKKFITTGTTNDCDIAAMANFEKNFYGLQFHPEVHHTEQGLEILNNFVFDVCKTEKNWKIENIIDDLILKIKKQVADKKVFLLVSGGVDSSVAFALLTKAIGAKKVYGLYIDTGFMRLNESDEIQKFMKKAGFDNLHVHDASQTFYEHLKGVSNPEQKRKIIGQTFLDTKDEVAKKLNLDPNKWILAQGTIYPDTIETGGTKHADTIKTHHNRVDAIQELIKQGKVIEPIADFYKDEVREIGTLLGLPEKIINRHPFPGPGLAIRILCHCEKKPHTHNKPCSDVKIAAVVSTLPRNDIRGHILPIKSVGVQGDNRTYANPLVIVSDSDWDELDKTSSKITNSTKEINRVLLLLNPKESSPYAEATEDRSRFNFPPKKKTLTQDRIALLQKIDDIVMQEITKAGLYDKIWQFATVLIPIGDKHHESIVLRPVVSKEAMTANFFHMPKDILKSIIEKIIATNQIDYIFYDITNKPPGTIEWE